MAFFPIVPQRISDFYHTVCVFLQYAFLSILPDLFHPFRLFISHGNTYNEQLIGSVLSVFKFFYSPIECVRFQV